MIFWYAFFALVIGEVLVFGIVADEIGFFGTLGLWFLSALAGGFLVRMQGTMTLARARESFEKGTTPVDAVFDGICIFAAGALFIFPGFISDVIALLLLVPQLRRGLRGATSKSFGLKEAKARTYDDGIIEAEFERVEEKPQQLP